MNDDIVKNTIRNLQLAREVKDWDKVEKLTALLKHDGIVLAYNKHEITWERKKED